MMSWPTIAQPTYTTGGEVYLPQIRTEFEGNYVQSRKRATRALRRWTLVWNAMTEAHYTLLDAAFISDQGTTFSWTEPVTSTNYTVRYSENSLKWNHVNKGVRSVQVGLETI
jgi:hypothetical protein